jgi:hypothetical protein
VASSQNGPRAHSLPPRSRAATVRVLGSGVKDVAPLRRLVLNAMLDRIYRATGRVWREECQFKPERRWRLDRAFEEVKVGLEVHGSVYAHGRHTRGTGFLNDRAKMNEAQIMGWIVIEVGWEQVENGAAEDFLLRAIRARESGGEG